MLSITADTIVVPLASEDDAQQTCRALTEHVEPGGRIVLLHVVEKAGGAPDKASVEQREERAEAIFAAGRAALDLDGRDVETEIAYGRDVADTIASASVEIDADLIAFSPRGASRLTRLLTGDTALDLLTDAPVPLVVLPSTSE